MSLELTGTRTLTADRDVDWIRESLQTAIELEHSTIPLYCAAMLSLEVQSYWSYNAIRSVLMEEMVHMAIAANMLAALGGKPRISGLDPGFPRDGLPGGVEPDLHVGLAKLSPAQLKNFMRLEAPLFLLPDEYAHESYPTIGKLYQGIQDAIEASADEIRAGATAVQVANQVPDNIGFATITVEGGADPVAQLLAGVREILEQGEGSTAETIQTGPDYQGEESHYGRFAELWYGRRYQPPEPLVALNRLTEAAYFQGAEITWPAVTNTLAVPADGYERLLAYDPAGADVRAALEMFDDDYSQMMASLDAMWNGPLEEMWPTFGKAIETMMKLRVFGCFNLMVHQIPPELVAQLPSLYPADFDHLARYTDLEAPVFYGPRFRNSNSNSNGNSNTDGNGDSAPAGD